MLDFTKLWDATYLFSFNSGAMSRSDLIFFWGAVVLLVAAVAVKVAALKSPKDSPKRFLSNRFFHLTLTTGVLILLWSAFRFQNIPWLSTHIVVLILWLSFLFWLGFIFWYYWRSFRSQHSEWQEEQTRTKYLSNQQ